MAPSGEPSPSPTPPGTRSPSTTGPERPARPTDATTGATHRARVVASVSDGAGRRPDADDDRHDDDRHELVGDVHHGQRRRAALEGVMGDEPRGREARPED